MLIVSSQADSVRSTAPSPESAPAALSGSQPATPTKTPATDIKDDSWQAALKNAVRDSGELCRILGLPSADEHRVLAAASDFPLFVPRSFVARMRKGDAGDPLLRQVLPLAAELESPQGYKKDPVGDREATLRPGLLHKYHGRVLMVATGACAVHCRYCFRRHFPYSSSPRNPAEWEPAIGAIAQDTSLREVILSGGDPLMIVDEHLAQLASRLAEIAHVRRLRVHTRLPIMIPERVNDELLAWLTGTRLTPIVVVHINHPAEIDPSVTAALERLTSAGIMVLNQAVLLAGVNDTADTLVELCEKLIDLRSAPYYLHQLDPVLGAAHFEVPVARGKRLMRELRRRLPGYAVPRYVREVAGAASKLPLE